MVIGGPKLVFDHRRPLKEVANRQFLGDANTAMRLNGVLPDKLC